MEMSMPLGVRKGAWTVEEDELLKKYIELHGVGKWHQVPSRAGLNRCRKSCRLRWLNYLSPNIKRGDFTTDEVDLIIRLHKLLGNRWSLIAGRLCGRTSNDIKNYWHTHLHKRHPCQKVQSDKEITKTKIYRPQPWTFTNTIPISTVLKNLNFNNLVRNKDTSSNSLSSLVDDHEKSWWDNLSLDILENNNFENSNFENAFTFSSVDNSIEESMKDNWISDDVGDKSLEKGQVSDWTNILTKDVDIGDLLNDGQFVL